MTTDTRPAPSGATMWIAVFGGIGAWTVHLVAEAALVAARGPHPDVVWVMHGLTAALVLIVLVWMRACRRMTQLSTNPESDASPGGRTVFLGWLGLAIGALNLLLIVYEGVLVAVWNHGIRN
jgi:hypothetical protein